LTAGSRKRGFVKDIMIVAIGVIIIWVGLQVIFGTSNPFYVVSSGSMVPKLQVFDVLVVQGHDPFETVKIGDIIVFNRPSGHDRVIVHRVASIMDEDPYTIRTKGDANPASIPGTDFPITEEEYIGKVQYVIPQVGYVTRILAPPINYIIISIIIGIMIFKQFAKKKREKELTFTDPFESSEENDKDKTQLNLGNLESSPKDTAYSEPMDHVQNFRKHTEDENSKSELGNKKESDKKES
jgi:signal peptidase